MNAVEIAKELILAEQDIRSARDRLTNITANLLPRDHPLWIEIREKRMMLYADTLPAKYGSDGKYFNFSQLIKQVIEQC